MNAVPSDVEPLGLTPRQLDAALAIYRFSTERHYSPSLRELGRMLGLRGKTGAYGLVQSLRERGWLASRPGSCRSMVLLHKPPGV